MESQVQAMVAVAQAGSFTVAGRRLGLTPSAISKLVSRLEKRIGARLFHRTTRKVQLTETGRRYAERAKRLLEELEALDRDAIEHDGQARGELRVTAPPMYGQVHVMPVAIKLLKRWPELKLTLDFTDRVVDVIAEGFDVAVRFAANPIPAAWSARRLTDERRVLCSAPSYFHKKGVPKTPEQLAQHEHVVFRSEGRSLSSLKVRVRPGSDRLVTVPLTGRIVVDGTRSALQVALAGLAISELDAYVADEFVKTGKLQVVMADHLPVERRVWLMHAPGPHVPAKVRVFVEAMLERVNNEA